MSRKRVMTIYWDTEAVEMHKKINISQEFLDEDFLVIADILKDVAGATGDLYKQSVSELIESYQERQAEAKVVKQKTRRKNKGELVYA